MSEGWIKLHRKLQDNPLWEKEPFTRGQAWVDLILLANHKPGFFYVRGNKVNVKRGQVGWSQERLSKRWKWSRKKVNKFLKDLETEQQIEQQKNNVTTVITIVNYKEYQKKEQQKEPQRNRRGTAEEPQRNTNKNDKNEKNISPLIENLNSVKRMKEPLTEEQGQQLVKEFGLTTVKNTLLAMENWKPLVSKNKSTNLTVRNWINRDNGKHKEPTFTPNYHKQI